MSDGKLDVVTELHKPARRNYPRRRYDIRDIDETWQADLVDMSPHGRINKGNRFILTVIDNFSKFAWAVPVRRKSAEDVTEAMESILQQGRVPKKLHVDGGKEFYNAQFQTLMRKYNIHMYSTFSGLKASICERFNRTLKNKMWMQFSLRGSFVWVDILPDLVDKYNHSRHRTIRMKPVDVTSENAKQIRLIFTDFRVNKNRPKFKVHDKVRISKIKHIFEKGYTPNWTTAIFTITQVKMTNPITYKLKDERNEVLDGCFYEEELLKAKHGDVYLVEKVLKKVGNREYVKWLGFDSRHNSWINASDTV